MYLGGEFVDKGNQYFGKKLIPSDWKKNPFRYHVPPAESDDERNMCSHKTYCNDAHKYILTNRCGINIFTMSAG